METLGLNSLQQAFEGRRVFVTGHSGFKGSWLSQWLVMLGAQVKGYSLAPETTPSHLELLGLEIDSEYADIRDRDRLRKSVLAFKPDIILHLAAQALVKRSYEAPGETFDTNVMGLVNLLDAALACSSAGAVLNVTSDKCYENRGIPDGYREDDPMGGHDPYSASKGCAELVSASYRRSFFAPAGKLLATARAGNVVGGGDWAQDRLVPDVIRAVANRQPVRIRRPQATRPWQHVLEPLHGYLLLAAKLLAGDAASAEGWNFGTTRMAGCSVREVLEVMHAQWPGFSIEYATEDASFHEADILQLNGDKAAARLGWVPALDIAETFALTMQWYRAWLDAGEILTTRQIEAYMKRVANDAQTAAEGKSC